MKFVLISIIFSSLFSFAIADEKKHTLPASALELIAQLKKLKGIHIIREDSRLDYVKEADLPELIKLIDSEEPCGHVVMSISSHLPEGVSTVGDEAAYLIDSYLKRFYPSKLSSDRRKPDKAKLKHWYRMYVPLREKQKKLIQSKSNNSSK